MNVLEVLLTLCFGFCWDVATLEPTRGATLLAILCSILTIPYFLKLFGTRIAGNLIVTLMLMVVGIVVPVLWPLVALWAFICLIGKLQRLLSSLPLILVGMLVYAATVYCPPLVDEVARSSFPQLSAAMLHALVGLLGGLSFWLLVRLTVAFGSTPNRSAALMLGCASYLVLFLLTFLLPHADGGEA